MQTLNDVHQQFAEFFKSDLLKPFAYLVSKRLAEGHICVPLADLQLSEDELFYFNKFGMSSASDKLMQEPQVATQKAPKQPFILHNDRLYLQRYFGYESAILASIRSLVVVQEKDQEERRQLLEKHKVFIRSMAATNITGENMAVEEKTDWQQVAAIYGALNNFTIITGGPGTGKTTTVAKILAILFTIHPSLKVALAAPTGKAAVRMAESLKNSGIGTGESIKEKLRSLVPSTIHRLLKYKPDSPYFNHNRANPLVYDLVIIDEASMIDAALFAKLLDAIAPGSRIILLGDKNQLASVEAGSLLGDLCATQQGINAVPAENIGWINDFIPQQDSKVRDTENCDKDNILTGHIVELKRSHRFTNTSGIGQFSKAIIGGNQDSIHSFIDAGSYPDVMVDTSYSDDIFNRFIEGYADYIKEKDIGGALAKLNQLRVLCAVREGPQGLLTVNRKIEAWLVKKGLLHSHTEFYENRPIIVTRNYPELNLYNGDVGIIRADKNGSIKAWFEDSNKNLVAVLPGYITSAETVFAMTIHKSQGSEYDRVLIMIPENADQPVLTRELLYTAVTRAKRLVQLQASRQSILFAVKKRVQRASGIMERFAAGE